MKTYQWFGPDEYDSRNKSVPANYIHRRRDQITNCLCIDTNTSVVYCNRCSRAHIAEDEGTRCSLLDT